MSKLVNWGHWAVTCAFGVFALFYLIRAIATVPFEFHSVANKANAAELIAGAVVLAFWIPFAVSCWGIWKWRRWGHALAIVMCVIFLATGAMWFFKLTAHANQPLAMLLISGISLIWLLSPAVWMMFWARGQVA